MTRERFLVYLNAMNNAQHDVMREFITDDIVLEFYDKPSLEKQTLKVLRGVDEYSAHFSRLHSRAKEHMELGFCLFDGEVLLTEQYTEFRALEDTVIQAGTLKKGQCFCNTNWLAYNFAPDGRFNRIRIAHFVCHDWEPKYV